MSSTRIYIVTTKDKVEPLDVRLVDAATQGQAIRHVTKDLFTAKTASAKETVDLMNKGYKVEVAVAEQPELPAQPEAKA